MTTTTREMIGRAPVSRRLKGCAFTVRRVRPGRRARTSFSRHPIGGRFDSSATAEDELDPARSRKTKTPAADLPRPNISCVRKLRVFRLHCAIGRFKTNLMSGGDRVETKKKKKKRKHSV